MLQLIFFVHCFGFLYVYYTYIISYSYKKNARSPACSCLVIMWFCVAIMTQQTGMSCVSQHGNNYHAILWPYRRVDAPIFCSSMVKRKSRNNVISRNVVYTEWQHFHKVPRTICLAKTITYIVTLKVRDITQKSSSNRCVLVVSSPLWLRSYYRINISYQLTNTSSEHTLVPLCKLVL